MLLKIKSILNSHKWAVIFAVLAGAIVIFPQLYLRYDIAGSYQGIEFLGAGDDEASWLGRVREVQDGHPSLSCVYLKDGKNDPYLIQPLGTIIAAALGNLFSLDINNTLLLARFFFTFIVFLLIYAFVYFLSQSKLAAVAGTAALVLGRDIVSRGGLQDLIAEGAPSIRYLNLVRPVNPSMTYFFFFGFLLFLWLFYTKKQWRWGILSILMLGLSFYDYFFTWTFLYIFCGMLLLIFIFQKKWQEAKRIFIVLFASALIAIPYFLNMYAVYTHPNYQEVSQRYGLVQGHDPIFGLLAPLLFGGILLFFPKKPKDRYFFALALALAPLIALNQQVITGRNLSSVHYHWYFTIPLFIIFSSTTLLLWLKGRRQKFFKITAAFIVLISVFSGILTQAGSYSANRESIIEKQSRYGKVMDWLSQNSRKEEVVFTDEETGYFVLIYTPLNLFSHFKAQACLSASKDLLLDGLFLNYRLAGVGKEEAQEFFFENRGDISHFIYGMYYDFVTGDYDGIPDEIILDFSKRYQSTLDLSASDFVKDMFVKYEVKYALWDKKNKPDWRLDRFNFLEKKAEFSDFTIYEYVD